MRRAAAIVVLLSLTGAAAGEQRFSVPKLGPDYTAPQTQKPPPRSAVKEYLDVGLLVVALAAMSCLALRRRSRIGVVIVTVLSLAYFGFYRKGCVCPVGAIQNVCPVFDVEARVTGDAEAAKRLGVDPTAAREAFHAGLDRLEGAESAGDTLDVTFAMSRNNKLALVEIGRTLIRPEAEDASPVQLERLLRVEMSPNLRFATGVPLVVIAFFALPLVFTLFFGRTFCAGVCPLGAIQDLVVLYPLRVPAAVEHGLGLVVYVYLAGAVLFAATGTGYLICRYDPFVSLFRLSGPAVMIAIGLGLLLVGTVLARPYCRFLCPYGAILRPLSYVSHRHVKITPDECVRCRLCEDSCPFGAIRPSNVDTPPPPRRYGKALLVGLLLTAPALGVAGGLLGRSLSGPLSGLHHTVKVAEQIRGEAIRNEQLRAAGQAELPPQTDETEAFAESRVPPRLLYQEAFAVRDSFRLAGTVLGAFLGLVIAGKLISLSIRRRREDYEPDRAKCLSCARCFSYCPVERKRRKSAHGEDNQ